MASVLFSTVGQALGGPLGAAIGVAVGGSLDSGLFGQRRQGAVDLFVQRSAYGEILPRVYGRTRVSGHLIWAVAPGGHGGKGSGRQAVSTSIAVALSSGPISEVRRIWADGREIRNAEGQFEATTIMRVHHGGGQQVDPLILAVEGAEAAPDYRGIAYVVFEDLDLAPFGNRIPNLSFEVVADGDGPRQWLAELGRRAGIGVDSSGEEMRLAVGYSSLERATTEAGLLRELGGLTLAYVDGAAGFAATPRLFELSFEEMLRDSDARIELEQANRPSGVALSYLDPERDYQAGRQRVGRGRRGVEMESSAPVCATAGMARALAGRQLRRLEAGSESVRFGLPWRWLHLAVGDQVVISGRGPWRIAEREVRGMRIYCRAERVEDAVSRPVEVSDPGRGQSVPMVPAGPTDIRLIEAPVPLVAGDASAYVWLGGGAGWRGATARQLVGGDERILGEVRDPSARALLLEALPPGPETIWDLRNSLLLQTEPGLPLFESRDAEAVLAGANLVLVGEELLQYCEANVEGNGIVRLSRLLRGRFGTDHVRRTAEPGESVSQIVPERLLPIRVPVDAIGSELLFLASGAGDPVGGTERTRSFEGLAMAPMAPAHLRVERRPDGAVDSRWAARSREAWGWNSAEIPGGTWRWTFQAPGRPAVVVELPLTELQLSVAEQAALSGGAFGAGVVAVEAVGDGPLGFRTAVTSLL